MSKLKITSGEVIVTHSPTSLNGRYSGIIATNESMTATVYGWSKEEALNNSLVYCDAHNTYNQCNLLSSELLQQNEELKEALHQFVGLCERQTFPTERELELVAIKSQTLLTKYTKP